ncbi:MAG: hypothetical protein HFE43_09755 [Oscillospiraceae bacterium]|nr:hypothetical protein [Oscillospiraceae bacterium]
MKRLEVRVCVCTQCVMNGAMDIVEAVESLQKLKNQLRFNASVKVSANERICDKDADASVSPLVIVNGERLEGATCDQVMSRIISSVS